MATKEEILDAISGMTVLELSELLSAFEERFGVTAAAPVAVAGAAPAAAGAGGGGGPARGGRERCAGILPLPGRGGAARFRRHPLRHGRQEDPGDQGGPRAHEPRAEGGQGPRGRCA